MEAADLFVTTLTIIFKHIERCKIYYLSAIEAKDAVMGFLRLIEQYEPKAVGERLPDAGFIPQEQ